MQAKFSSFSVRKIGHLSENSETKDVCTVSFEKRSVKPTYDTFSSLAEHRNAEKPSNGKHILFRTSLGPQLLKENLHSNG